MANETVVYRNEMNLVPLRNFSSMEINLFFVMCNKLKEQGSNKIEIPFDELRELSNYYTYSLERFSKILENIYDKMLRLTYIIRSEGEVEKFVLFTHYRVSTNQRALYLSINTDLKHILNSITGNITKFELQELTHIKSSYSKNMFRLLKQYKHTGYYIIKIDDFRDLLDIPKSYRINDISARVLNPIINELTSLFPNLRINKIKAKKGRRIEKLEFTFDKEQQTTNYNYPQRSTDGQNSKSGSKYSKPIKSREKTPQWIEERDNKKLREDTTDEKLEEDRKAFLKQLEKDWEEE